MKYQVLILSESEQSGRELSLSFKNSGISTLETTHSCDEVSFTKLLRNKSFSAIVANFNLQDCNAFQVLELRALYSPNIPVIVLAEHLMADTVTRLIKQGAHSVIERTTSNQSIPDLCYQAIEVEHKKESEAINKRLLSTIRRYKLLFNATNDGILIGQPSGKGTIVEANPAFCNLVGYTLTELKTKTREDILVGFESALTERDKRLQYTGEVELLHKNGTHIPVEITSQIIEIELHNRQSLTIVRDLRRRKEMEELEREKHRVRYLQKDIAEIINRNVNFRLSMKECLFRINHFLDWSVGHIYFREEFKKEAPFVSSDIWYFSKADQFSAFKKASVSTQFLLGEGLIGIAASTQLAQWFRAKNSTNNFKRSDAAAECDLNLGLLLPVIVQGKTEAVLEFFTQSHAVDEFAIQETMETLTAQISQLFERKITLDRLNKEKERFRMIAENSSDMISQHTIEGTYTYVSPASAALLGFTPEELIGQNAYDFIYRDDIDYVKEQHENIMHRRPFSTAIHYRLKQKNGSTKWVETSNRVLRESATGKVVEIHASTRDITFRKAYETELKEHINFNESILNSLPGIFFMLSQDGRVLRVNKQLEKALDYSFEEIANMHYLQFIAPNETDDAINAISKAFEEGFVQVELHVLSKNGEQIPHLMTGFVTKLHGQTHLLGIGIDISDRRKAEKALKGEKKFVEQALNSLPGLFYMMDDSHRFIRVNDHFKETLGFTAGQLNTINPLEIYHKEDREAVQNALQMAFKHGQAHVEARLKTTTGEYAYYYINGMLLNNGDKNFLLGTGIDISDRVSAKVRLIDSLSEKETLLSEVHHRVKNNLALVSGIMQLQGFQTDNKEVHQYIENSVTRIKSISIIHELLYQSESFNDVRFDENIKKLVSHLNNTSSLQNTIQLDLDLNEVHLNVNQAIPSAMLINELLTNVYKHAFLGRKKGNIRVTLTEDDRQNISITVQDDGVGLPEGFTFNKPESLGITLIRTLSEQLGATLSYKSTSKGTTFTIAFKRRILKGSASAMV